MRDVPKIVLLNKNSAFEEIKLIDDEGIEYWLARDLMPVLGYRQWRQFNDAILRAIASCKNVGNDCDKHFLRSIAKSSGGRPREDFRLSRYGAYLTAMNGDSRKAEIAAAQSYFAYKTREAELTSFSQQSFDELVQKIEQQNKVIEGQGKAIAQLQEQIQNLLPVSADYIPPGWSPEIWHSLPPQDKQHFWFLHHRRNFRPSNQGIEPLELPAVTIEQIKQKQHDEFQQVVGEILEEEKKRIEVIKRELLNQFWAEGGES